MTSVAGRHVLLVEDEIFLAWMLGDIIETLGYKMIGPATRVDEAMALIDAHDLDAAILDVNLNGEMSYPVADRLAAQGVPFLLSTAYHRDRLPDAYQTSPMLQKPYHPSALAKALTEILAPDLAKAQNGGPGEAPHKQ